MTQVDHLYLYSKYHCSIGAFQIFYLQKPNTRFIRKWNICQKWIKGNIDIKAEQTKGAEHRRRKTSFLKE